MDDVVLVQCRNASGNVPQAQEHDLLRSTHVISLVYVAPPTYQVACIWQQPRKLPRIDRIEQGTHLTPLLVDVHVM